ncbi:tRNA pseudouridine(38-40) synthase TruA [candidate division WOR-3 bacterium]|nr:tRNA pseudouridine(38-40) synthase TruA [candidate division WOR-3 bacterium]
MRRIKFEVSYDGRQFSGWQIQKAKRTAQEELEKAIFSVTKNISKVTGAGRTDAGVHAIGQTAHCDIQCDIQDLDLLRAVNSNLPCDLKVKNLLTVEPDFHSTKDAGERQYVYRIEYTSGNPFTRGFAWQLRKRLSVEKMAKTALLLKGKHDFSAFCIKKSLKQNNEVDLRAVEIVSLQNGLLLFFAADRYLHKLIRSIVGMLYDVGRGKADPETAEVALLRKNRIYGGFTAPAQGLYLYRVLYSGENANFSKEEFFSNFTGT